MSSALEHFVPFLDGPNFQTWKRQMRAFLQSQDLWGIVNATIVRPVPAAAQPTPAEAEAIAAWDALASKALGNIVLRLTAPVYQKVEQMNAPEAWVELQCLYGAVSPSQVFEFFKKTVLFRLDITKSIHPQIDHLDGFYSALTAEQVDLPDFVRAMQLLTALPNAWEAPVIQQVMSGGTITAITFQHTKETILRYWDAEKARVIGSKTKPHTATKISAVKRKPYDPSYQSQKGKAPYKGDTQGGQKKKKRGTRGGNKGKSAHTMHIANSASLPAPSSHTVARYNPSGLINRIATDTPITSSYGNGPYPSFNDAMVLADEIGVPKSSGNVKRLEERITMRPPAKGKGKEPAIRHVILLSSDESGDDASSVMTEKTQSPPSDSLLFSPLSAANTASLSPEPFQTGGWNTYDMPVKPTPS